MPPPNYVARCVIIPVILAISASTVSSCRGATVSPLATSTTTVTPSVTQPAPTPTFSNPSTPTVSDTLLQEVLSAIAQRWDILTIGGLVPVSATPIPLESGRFVMFLSARASIEDSGIEFPLLLAAYFGTGGRMRNIELIIRRDDLTREGLVFLSGLTLRSTEPPDLVFTSLFRMSSEPSKLSLLSGAGWMVLDGEPTSREAILQALSSNTLLTRSILEAAIPVTGPLDTAAVLAELGYADEAALYPPDTYQILRVEWQGLQYEALVFTDPVEGFQRIDGMKIRSQGNEEWIRGVYYRVGVAPDFGGFVIDAVFDDPRLRAGFADAIEGPNTLYAQLVRAIAFQRGISSEKLDLQLRQTRYVLSSLYLPEVSHPHGLFEQGSIGFAAPSFLRPSRPTTVDLGRPVQMQWRSGDYPVKGLNVMRIGEGTLLVISERTSASQEAMADWNPDGHLMATYVTERRLSFLKFPIAGRDLIPYNFPQRLSLDLFTWLELLAQTHPGFSESPFRTRASSLLIHSLNADTWGQYSLLDPQVFAPRDEVNPIHFAGSLIGPVDIQAAPDNGDVLGPSREAPSP